MEGITKCAGSDVLRIFSGSSHPELASEIAAYLGCPLCPRVTQRFSNDNLFVHLG
jgi:ribose-phosphate pyrophosphokinase